MNDDKSISQDYIDLDMNDNKKISQDYHRYWQSNEYKKGYDALSIVTFFAVVICLFYTLFTIILINSPNPQSGRTGYKPLGWVLLFTSPISYFIVYLVNKIVCAVFIARDILIKNNEKSAGQQIKD